MDNCFQAHSHSLQDDIANVKNQIRDVDKAIYDTKEELSRKEIRLKELEDKKKNKSGREKDEIEKRIKETMAALTATEAELDAVCHKGKETKTAIDRKAKSIQSDKKELEKKQNELKKLEAGSGGEEKRGKEAEEAVKRARNKIEALAKGMTTDEEGHAVTLDAQLTDRLKQLEPSLAKKKNELQLCSSQADSEERERSDLERKVRSIEVIISFIV
ncbi:unnamed protein product [Gongylonema pulchrum]|uniref:Myosin_tail_1 domain-containing protein n=1 Tax=Gongylonema pulchrum TaxID=637853 RepID=A0A183DWR0_9BILA|nr:unnamed protein product [Gongylonema pulchrum]